MLGKDRTKILVPKRDWVEEAFAEVSCAVVLRTDSALSPPQGDKSSKLTVVRMLHTLAVNQSWLAFSNPFLGQQGEGASALALCEVAYAVAEGH